MHKGIVITLTLAFASLLLLNLPQGERTPSELFQAWRNKHGLMLGLSPVELVYREKIFSKNLQEIEAHNANPAHTYKQGVNQFTAYTQQEFEALFLSKIEGHAARKIAVEEKLQDSIEIDWVLRGAVTPVRNEGSCIATYAFSAIGGIEGVAAISSKSLVEFSVQQIIDCSTSYGNNGCHIGNMINSFRYIADKGIQTEAAYPYRGNYGSCKTSAGYYRIKGFNSLYSCTDLETALAERPISIAVDGSNFRSYSSGVFSNCGRNLNLAGLLVGATDQFYRVKNSWGTGWGEAGYIRLYRMNDVCGICDAGSYPIPA